MEKSKTTEAVRHENPLMPDERLRQIYTAMVGMRLLEEHLQHRRAGTKRVAKRGDTVYGEEAARASTALSLGAGDLLADCGAAPGMALLLGAELKALRRSLTAKVAKTKAATTATAGAKASTPAVSGEFGRTLPLATDAEERMERSLGAAAVLKVQGAGRVLLVYARPEEMRRKVWKRALGAAGEQELPMIFVALPHSREGSSMAEGELAQRARSWGVPGFPVDGSDAVALFRVMQESLLRGRTGGGPALLECIAFARSGEGVREDPVERLAELLLAKGVASEQWTERTRSAFRKRLTTGSRR